MTEPVHSSENRRIDKEIIKEVDNAARISYIEFMTDYISGLNKTYDGRSVGLIGVITLAQFLISAILTSAPSQVDVNVLRLLYISVVFFFLALGMLINSIRPITTDPGSAIGSLTFESSHTWKYVADQVRKASYDDIVDALCREMRATSLVAERKGRWITWSMIPLAVGYAMVSFALFFLIVK